MVKSRAWQWHILGVFAALWVCVGNIAIASADDAMLYGPSDANAKQGGVLTVGSTLEPPSFDILHQASDVINRFAGLMYEGLVWVDSSSVSIRCWPRAGRFLPATRPSRSSSGKGSSFTTARRSPQRTSSTASTSSVIRKTGRPEPATTGPSPVSTWSTRKRCAST